MRDVIIAKVIVLVIVYVFMMLNNDDKESITRRDVLKGVAAAGALSLVPGTARADHDDPITDPYATPVDDCTIINNSGTYLLTRDLQSEGTCIQIRQSNVTFDGQGHTIEFAHPQEPGRGYGIYIRAGRELSNVTIRNVTVRGFDIGIRVQDARVSTISRVTATENRDGFFVNRGTNMLIISNTASHNTDAGMKIRGYGNTIRANTVDQNGVRGIYVRNFSGAARVLGNTVTGHQGELLGDGSPGIVLSGDASRSHLVAGNELGGNRIGILLNEAKENTIRRNHTIESRFSTDTAIKLKSFSHGNLIEHNTFERGIQVSRSNDNLIRRNSLARDILITNSAGNTLFDNDVLSAFLTDATRTLVLGNRMTGTDIRPGTHVRRSTSTVIRGNIIADKGIGVSLQDADRTSVEFNSIRDNRIGTRLLGSGAATTAINGNNFRRNAEYGVQNEVPEIVDGRFNYWGTSSGPSSPDPDASVADPVTGELADGTGNAVSESPDRAGVSNVRFDPWSRRANPRSILPPVDLPPQVDPLPPIDPPIFPFDLPSGTAEPAG